MKSKRILALVVSASMLSSFAFGTAGFEKCFASSNDYVAAKQHINPETSAFLYAREDEEKKADDKKVKESEKDKKEDCILKKIAKGTGNFLASSAVYSAIGVGAVEFTDNVGYTDSSKLLDNAKNVLVVKDLFKDGWNVKGIAKNVADNKEQLGRVLVYGYNAAYTIPVCLTIGSVALWLGNKLGFSSKVGKMILAGTGAAMSFARKDSFFNSFVKKGVDFVSNKIFK